MCFEDNRAAIYDLTNLSASEYRELAMHGVIPTIRTIEVQLGSIRTMTQLSSRRLANAVRGPVNEMERHCAILEEFVLRRDVNKVKGEVIPIMHDIEAHLAYVLRTVDRLSHRVADALRHPIVLLDGYCRALRGIVEEWQRLESL